MEVKKMNELYGYKEDKPLVLNDLKRLYNFLYEQNPNPNIDEEYYPYNIYNLREDAANFFNALNLNIHSVPYINMDDLLKIDDLSKQYDNMVELINPFDLPVFYANYSIFSGQLGKALINSENYPSVIFLAVGLGKILSQITFSSYIHEITHTQVDSVKGSVEKEQNSEVLSIFMEKLAANYIGGNDLLNAVNNLRNYYILSCLSDLVLEVSPENTRENNMYIASNFQADELYYKYANSNKEEKAQIIDNIQNIFDGNITLESVLDEMNISVQTSTDEKVLKKRLLK